MITPLKWLFSVMLKSPLSQLRIPSGSWQTSWLFTKHGEFAPCDHGGPLHLVARVGDLNPGLLHSNPEL